MYFDTSPKTEKNDLFSSELILNKLIKSLKDPSKRLIVIKGLRRTGKTSLLNVALKECSVNYVKIDVRDFPFFNYNDFVTNFINIINSHSTLNKNIIKKIINKIEEVDLSIGYDNVKTTTKFKINNEKRIPIFLEELNNTLKKNNKTLIIAIDEVQLLKEAKIDYLFASIYDNYKSIKLVFTGSEIGLLDEFIGVNNYDAPLYGRYFEVVETKRLRRQESYNFLKGGFSQLNKNITADEIELVVERLDGIIGWLTQYGYERSKGASFDDCIYKVVNIGIELNRREFNNFLTTRKEKESYVRVMSILTKGVHKWSDIKREFGKQGIKLKDAQLSLYLKALAGYSFIEEKNSEYYITDPLLEKVF